MLIWNANKKIPENIHKELVDRIEKNYSNREEYFTSFNNSEGKFKDILVPYYQDIMEQMMRNLGLWKKATYSYNVWTQMYNSQTTTHAPHSHFAGNVIISFTHIINASKEKCFYFLDDDNNKIYPSPQQSGDIFAWPSWSIHGVDKVQEPNVNRLIVAGNVALHSYNFPNEKFSLECTDDQNGKVVWRNTPYG